MKYNKLVRDNVAEFLKNQGYQEIKGKKLKGEKYKTELYSLFLQEYKETLDKDKPQHLQVHYANMLEIVRTLMVYTKTNVKQIKFDTYDQHVIDWYKSSTPIREKSVRLSNARIDLLQKFDELLQMKTEAINDQLVDTLVSFKYLVEANEFSWSEIEKQRRDMYKKLGGFSQGVYLESVSKTKTNTSSYSA